MTPSITACPPTIRSRSFVLMSFVEQAFLPVDLGDRHESLSVNKDRQECLSYKQ